MSLCFTAILVVARTIVASRAHALEPAPDTSTVAEYCPRYASNVKAARSHLSRGERKRALDEFLRARKALESCIEKDKEAENQTASVFGLTECPLPEFNGAVSN